MPLTDPQLHVYSREITATERTSLSVLSNQIPPNATVLDLGCGTGALGKWLSNRGDNILDGVTHNEQEAAQARTCYRRVVVSDLDAVTLQSAFEPQAYDVIVCADVLEHLKFPEKILQACHHLLKPGGRLLASVPNAAYAGLVAELMQGQFQYRNEGLLDRTHLRFFTRATLVDFLAKLDWAVDVLETIERTLPESEFHIAFDTLPPAVSRYLLCRDDALTYQFVLSCISKPEPSGLEIQTAGQVKSTPEMPLFSAELLLGDDDGFHEQRKLTTRGRIGGGHQTLQFLLSPQPRHPFTRLRLDPADRPGFLHLHAIRLQTLTKELIWSWQGGQNPTSALDEGQVPQHQICWHLPGVVLPTPMLLLLGDDPWFEMPIPSDLVALATTHGATLEIEVGWPMSADYLYAANTVANLLRKEHSLHEVSQTKDLEIEQLARENEHCLAEISTLKQHLQVATSKVAADALRWQMERSVLAGNERRAIADKATAEARLHQLRDHLTWIENSTVFRATRPLVNAKMALASLLAPRKATPMHRTKPMEFTAPVPVDVIVPVYKGLDDTQRCIRSALASPCKTPFQLIVINDSSPEPEVTHWLRQMANSEPRMTLLENAENLGSVGTVNRGMTHNPEHDILLLNSDTEVANDWLDRLQRAAYSADRIASVTPFSNNATICSYPRFCQPNALVKPHTTASLDALCAQTLPGIAVDVPTGVGFCMYIRRDCVNDIGLFDVENFGKGYGEENDFCCRASAAGWRNLHALDTFVLHTGGVSFGDSKSARELAAMETLRRLHPNYERDVVQFVQVDPAQSHRHSLDVARLAHSPLPTVLAITHDRAGGTLRHVKELAHTLNGQAHFLCLMPLPGNRVSLEWIGEAEGFRLEFAIDTDFEGLIQALQFVRVELVHYHHLLGHNPVVQAIPKRLGVPFDFTAHDHYSHCPQISLTDHLNKYCGEKGDRQCADCLRRSPAPGGVAISTWRNNYRAFLSDSRYVLAPSRDAAQRMVKLVPAADVRVAPHTDIVQSAVLPSPLAGQRPSNAPLKVVVIGALSIIKGADVLEAVAASAKMANAPIEFHLIGYAYRNLKTRPASNLTVHGEYKESELRGMLDWLQPDIVWFPALWPETYSYTLSACLEVGLPVVAPNLGAFPERLHQRPWSWVMEWSTQPAQWLEFFVQIHDQHFIPNAAPLCFVHTSATEFSPPPRNYVNEDVPGTGKPSVAFNSCPAAEWLDAYRPGRAHSGLPGVSTSARRRALAVIVRLRSVPVLRGVAKSIPLRWQTRVKSWLVR